MYENIHAALRFLAARCDGAQSEDGQGFNKLHSSIGKQLAYSNPNEWDDPTAIRAWKIANTYKNQLASSGIDIGPEPTGRRTVSIATDDFLEEPVDGYFTLTFPYNEGLIKALKTIDGWQYDPENKAWTVPVRNPEKFERWATAQGFELTDEVREHFSTCKPEYDIPVKSNATSATAQGQGTKSTAATKVTHRYALLGDGANPTVRFYFPYDETHKNQLKAAFQGFAHFHKGIGGIPSYWEVNISERTIDQLVAFLKSEAYEVNAELQRALEEYAVIAKKIREESDAIHAQSMAMENSKHIAVNGITGIPRAYQLACLEYVTALPVSRAIIGDQMGLGKTIEAIITMQYRNAYPALIICRPRLRINWQREVSQWVPGLKILVIRGKKALPSYEADVVICGSNLLKEHEALWNVPWKMVIADESQDYKNKKAARTIAANSLMGLAQHRLALSGTAILSKPAELIPQLQMLGIFKDLFKVNKETDAWKHFVTRYCDGRLAGGVWDISGHSNEEELNEILRSHYAYIRREKTDVLKELPEKTRQRLVVELENREEYDRAENDFVTWFREQHQDSAKEAWLEEKRGEYAAKWAKQERQEFAAEQGMGLVSDTVDFDSWLKEHYPDNEQDILQPVPAMDLVRVEALTEFAALGKVSAAIEWAKDTIESGLKVGLFAHHRSVQDALFEGLKDYQPARVIGGQNDKQAQENIDRFQHDPNCGVIVCSIKAAGVGITLTAGSVAGFLEYPWTPADLDQCEDRFHRMGQKNAVQCVYFVGKDSIDTWRLNFVESKRPVVDKVAIGHEDTSVVVTWGDLADYLNRRHDEEEDEAMAIISTPTAKTPATRRIVA